MLHSSNAEYKTTKENLEKTIEQIVDDLLPNITDNTIIDGGNFQIRNEIYKTHYLATATFQTAALLYKKSKEQYKEVELSFLIDNFGIRKQTFKLPKEYLEILKKHTIKSEEIIYFKESHLRNRATRLIKNNINKISDQILNCKIVKSRNISIYSDYKKGYFEKIIFYQYVCVK